MTETIKVRQWIIDRPNDLTQLLEQLALTPLTERVKSYNTSTSDRRTVQLESIEQPSDFKAYWCLDFAKHDPNGAPGKGKAGETTTGLNFEEGRMPTYETAAIFDPASRRLAMQYNHHGIRPEAVFTYLHSFDANLQFSHNLCLTPRSTLAYDTTRPVRRFDVRIELPSDPSALLEYGHSLSSIAAPAASGGAESLEIVVSMGNRKGGLTGSFKQLFNDLQDALKRNNSAAHIARARATIGADDESWDTVSLIDERLEAGVDAPSGTDHRVTAQERWKCILRAMNSEGFRTAAGSNTPMLR